MHNYVNFAARVIIGDPAAFYTIAVTIAVIVMVYAAYKLIKEIKNKED